MPRIDTNWRSHIVHHTRYEWKDTTDGPRACDLLERRLAIIVYDETERCSAITYCCPLKPAVEGKYVPYLKSSTHKPSPKCGEYVRRFESIDKFSTNVFFDPKMDEQMCIETH
jgi:hypothetical protein